MRSEFAFPATSRMDSGQLMFGGCYNNMICMGNTDPFLQVSATSSINRSFYGITDETLIDDEFPEGHAPEKKRRLTSEQVDSLERSFEAENKLEPQRRSQLAKELGLQPRQISVWFQNRRARWKAKQLERDYDLLKSAYGSLASDYQGLLKEHRKLKSEVISLQEKLIAKEMVNHKTCISSPETGSANLTYKEEEGLSSGGSTVGDDDNHRLTNCGKSSFPSYASFEALQREEADVEKICSSNQWLCVDAGDSSYLMEVYAVEEQPEEAQLGWLAWS